MLGVCDRETRRSEMRHLVVAGGLTVFLAFMALGAAAEDAGYIFVPGSEGRLPCYIGGSPASSRHINLCPATDEVVREVEIPAAACYYEKHGWVILESCLRVLDQDPAQVSEMIQAHGYVAMTVDGMVISPARIEVLPGVLEERAAWSVGWCFELPADIVQPGVLIVSVTWSRDLQLACDPEGVATTTRTKTVTVLRPAS
jgi:hypothetical protein